MPITRMLPGSSPCELRLLLPDTNIGKDGFHDVVVENLIGSSTWRSRHVSPSDVIALRRRWPRAVFQVMKERSTELEDLRRQAYTGLQWAYRYAHLGYCPECKTRTYSSLESHMMCCHLGLGQLWRCPIEWCAVWKGSVRECRDHFNDKHSGSVTLDFEKVSRSFPAWTVTCKFWEQALNPKISGIAVMFDCSTSPEDDWYTNTGCTRTQYHTRHSVRKKSPSCSRSLTEQWLLPSSHIYGLRFHHQVLPRGKCRVTASRKPQHQQLRRDPDE